jgi:uncharacterized NAD-dependent epimerase/dehydratase family protein
MAPFLRDDEAEVSPLDPADIHSLYMAVNSGSVILPLARHSMTCRKLSRLAQSTLLLASATTRAQNVEVRLSHRQLFRFSKVEFICVRGAAAGCEGSTTSSSAAEALRGGRGTEALVVATGFGGSTAATTTAVAAVDPDVAAAAAAGAAGPGAEEEDEEEEEEEEGT